MHCRTNSRVDSYNEAVSQHIISKYKLTTHKCVAQHEASHTPGNLVNLDMMARYKDSTSSLPHPTLNLFCGALVMLTRNFMASRGLVNGAVFIVDAVLKNTLHVVNVSGSPESNPHYGSSDTLFRFTFPVDESGIKFTRKQYPIKPIYAGTTHRLQGETISLQGRLMVDVTYPAFLHGQAYVTFSRARTESQIYAVCRADGLFTTLTYTRMLGKPQDGIVSDLSVGISQTVEENHSSDSERDDPFYGTGADWFAEKGLTSVSEMNTCPKQNEQTESKQRVVASVPLPPAVAPAPTAPAVAPAPPSHCLQGPPLQPPAAMAVSSGNARAVRPPWIGTKCAVALPQPAAKAPPPPPPPAAKALPPPPKPAAKAPPPPKPPAAKALPPPPKPAAKAVPEAMMAEIQHEQEHQQQHSDEVDRDDRNRELRRKKNLRQSEKERTRRGPRPAVGGMSAREAYYEMCNQIELDDAKRRKKK